MATAPSDVLSAAQSNTSAPNFALNELGGAQSVATGGNLSLPAQIALALPTQGASFLYNPLKEALGIGNGPNYKAALDRSHFATTLGQQLGHTDGFTFNTTNGTKTIDPNAFSKDQSTYNVDMSKPNAGFAISLVNPLAYAITGGNTKLANDFAGQLANSIYDDNPQNIAKNALSIYETLKADPAQLSQTIDGMATAGTLTADQQNVFKNTIGQLTEGGQIAYPTASPPQATPAAKALTQAPQAFTPNISTQPAAAPPPSTFAALNPQRASFINKGFV